MKTSVRQLTDKVGHMRIKQERGINAHTLSEDELTSDALGIVEQDEVRAFFIPVCKVLRVKGF